MATKKVVQDIVPSSRRSIRLVPLRHDEPELRTKRSKVTEIVEDVDEAPPVIAKKRISSKTQGKFPKILIFLIILICIAIIGFALSLLYSKAIVTITPETLDLTVDGGFIAKKDANGLDSLGYQVITISDEAHKFVTAVDGPLVQTKAKGTVTLFNNHSTSSQKIVAGTRLSGSNGLVYKTLSSVTIPGKKTVLGKTTLGSIAVGVIADQYGSSYNATVSGVTSDFKFIGYKGTDKYANFYARIKTDITGGTSGKKKTIPADVEKSAVQEMQETVKEKLLAKVSTIIPAEYVMFTNAFVIDYQRLSTSTELSNTADIGIKGTMYGLIFNSKNLIDSIAKKQIQKTGLVEYKINGVSELDFKIINTKDFSAKKGTTLSFSLKGPIKVVGEISEKALKDKLLGLKLKDIDGIIKQNPSVKYVKVLLTPFWMRSFPNSPENIIFEYK